MVQDLNHYSYARALEREKILAKLGPELTADLYVNSSWRDRPPSAVRRMDQEPGAESSDEDDDDEEEIDPEGGGSRTSGLTAPSAAKALVSGATARLKPSAPFSNISLRSEDLFISGGLE